MVASRLPRSRPVRVVAFGVLVAAFTLVRSPATGQAELIHIRPIDAATANLLVSGLQRSPKLRALAERIERSNVIVLCGRTESLRGRRGALVWMAAADDARYVRAVVIRNLEPDAAIATLGHELQHAVELSEAPWVTNLLLFEALFRDIGSREMIGPGWYDTPAARAAGAAVLKELKADPAPIHTVLAAPLNHVEWNAEYTRLRDTAAADR